LLCDAVIPCQSACAKVALIAVTRGVRKLDLPANPRFIPHATSRLRALRRIAERPRSTQELAPLVGITEAAMSKHLRQLAETGVLEGRRDGRYVLYHLRAVRLEPLSESLLAYLQS
jgi:DNA-binding transcriptional ArsR family regulator